MKEREEADTLEPIPGLVIGDAGFSWKGTEYDYSDIRDIYFTATITRTSVNLIPTGRIFEAKLKLRLSKGSTISLDGGSRMFSRGLRESVFNGMQQANAILSALTLIYRLPAYEADFERRGFFNVGEHQFHKSGDVFHRGQLVASVQDEGWRFLKEPFALLLIRKEKTLWERLKSTLSDDTVRIPIEWNQDCVLFMLSRVYGMEFQGSPPPERPVDRRRVFYSTVIRFGARLAAVDGTATPEELQELKRFFQIDAETLSDAARIFNEEISSSSPIGDILNEFAEVFRDAEGIREAFLMGMCSVSLADGILDQAEFDLLEDAAAYLGLGRGSATRVFIAAGVDVDELFGARRTRGTEEDSFSGRRTGGRRAAELEILGLKVGAGDTEIRAAYRELVKRYHPDRLRGQGLPEAEIARSEELLKRVNEAYSYLTRSA